MHGSSRHEKAALALLAALALVAMGLNLRASVAFLKETASAMGPVETISRVTHLGDSLREMLPPGTTLHISNSLAVRFESITPDERRTYSLYGLSSIEIALQAYPLGVIHEGYSPWLERQEYQKASLGARPLGGVRGLRFMLSAETAPHMGFYAYGDNVIVMPHGTDR